ncbi:AfsA-related hotdog domain-containing protein [Streptomyces sp. NPDC048462]|uniref:AfsA-related hotdog domain-containing protein n=1 Tax=Streptomyces sp. NPDC048462 TaxID=3365555 RepID=UPI003712436D
MDIAPSPFAVRQTFGPRAGDVDQHEHLPAPSPSASFLGPHHLVHCPDTPEAFVLASTEPVRQHFAFSTELPQDHPLFSDATAPFHDLLYPVESLRQTALFAAGRYFRVPENRRTLVTTSAAVVTDVAPWQRSRTGSQLGLDLDLTPTEVVKGVPRGMRCRASVSIDGAQCGTAEARLLFLMPGVYRNHRTHGRQESDHSAQRNSGLPPGHATPAPSLVGRGSARNVMIGLPFDESEEGLTFPVDVPAAREVLPDAGHEVPASLFLETSRQAALFAAGELYGFAPSHTLLTNWRASFRGFAEPGLPLRCSVQPLGEQAGSELRRNASGQPVAELRLTFVQGSRVVSTVAASVLQIC